MSRSKRLDPSPKNGILRVVKKVFDRPIGSSLQLEPGRSNVDPLLCFSPAQQGTTDKSYMHIISFWDFVQRLLSSCPLVTPITTGANS